MIFFQFLKLSKETQAIHDSHCRVGLCSHEEWGIRVYKKPQNRTDDNKNTQNRNKFRSKSKTGSKTREDVHVVEIVRRIFSAENLEKHQLQTASNSKSKTQFHFCQKPKTESEIEQKLETAIVTKTENRKFFGTKAKKNDLKKDETANPKTPMPPSMRNNCVALIL